MICQEVPLEIFLFRCCAILVSSPQASARFLSGTPTIRLQGVCFLSFPHVHFWGAIGGGMPNRTGNIPRRGSGLSCRLSQPEAGSLTRFTASIIKPLMLHRKGDRTRQLSVGVLGVTLHLLTRFYFSCPKSATIGFEPMIPVRFRMLSASSRLRQGFKLTHKLRLLNDGLTPLPVYGLGADLIRSSWIRTNILR